MTRTQRHSVVMDPIADELRSATRQHKPLNSAHEGYAVILEELDELWAEICKRRDQRSHVRLRAEAIQIAAMAARFLTDVIPDDILTAEDEP